MNITYIELFTLPTCKDCPAAKLNIGREFPNVALVVYDCSKSENLELARNYNIACTPTSVFHFTDGSEKILSKVSVEFKASLDNI